MKGVPKVDNSKNSNADRPFGTFDWTNLSPEQVNKPKDITSDMWTPISAGKVYSQTPPPSRLDDREKGGQKKKTAPRQTGKQTTAKKSPSAAGKKTAAPSKKAPQSKKRKPAGKRGEQSGRTPERPAQTARRRPPENQRARTQIEAQREQKRLENDRKRYEKSSREYNRQRSAGKAGEEITKKRAKKKRRSKHFYALVVTGVTLFVAACAALVFCFAVGSPIAQINVEGESIYSAGEIMNSCGVVIGDNIFTVSRKRVNEAVCRALPYIGSVEVRRSFPDKLSLTVQATEDKYLIKTKNSSYICLDENCKVLSVKKKKVKKGSFRFDGFEGQTVQTGAQYTPCEQDKQRFEVAKRIVEALESNSLKEANVIDLTDLDKLSAVYDSRYKIIIGSTDKLESKIALAASTLRKSASKKGTGYVDVRFEGMAAFAEGNMEAQ